MYPLKRLHLLALGLLAAGTCTCSCSSHDVSLGEDPPPTPTPAPTDDPTPVPVPIPTPVPVPVPVPTPTPTPTYACELQPGGSCLPSSEHCDGRWTTRAGYECGPDTTCCEVTVGTGAPDSGGASNADPAPSGAGGQ